LERLRLRNRWVRKEWLSYPGSQRWGIGQEENTEDLFSSVGVFPEFDF